MPVRFRVLILTAVTFVTFSIQAAKPKIPKGFRLEQSVVIPTTCPDSGNELVEPTELTATIKKALNSNQTSCVNVPIDPEFVLRIGASKLSV